MNLNHLYDSLLKRYNHQGWWPLTDLHKNDINPTKTGSIKGYHPKDYSYPKNKKQQWEIIIGALLTQNTNWICAEKAIINLKNCNLLSPEKILAADLKILQQAVKPSGYFRQKSTRLKILADWFLNLKSIPERKDLLSLNGIGPETADSILLYAYKEPHFIIDTYTKRILHNLNISTETDYQNLQNIFHEQLTKDYKLYQEFHALLVEHAKHHYLKRPYFDPLKTKALRDE